MEKRNRIMKWIISIIIICFVLLYISCPKYDNNKAYVKEYIVGEIGIKGNVDILKYGDDPAYEIGANREGYAVFKHPNKAFHQMKIDYAKGIAAIQKEYMLLPISRWNYKKYMNYGWQLTKTKNSEAVAQANKLKSLLDIYENSF